MRLAAAAVFLIALPAAANLCDVPDHQLSGSEEKIWTVATQRLVLCKSPSGMYVVAAGQQGLRLMLLSEHADWEYKAAPPNFTFTIYTWRSAAEPRVPLLRCDIFLGQRIAKPRSVFLLRGPRYSETRFQEHLREFRDPAATDMRRQELLYAMRDEGVSRPARALELLRSLETEGFLAKELAGILGDLELARTLPHQ